VWTETSALRLILRDGRVVADVFVREAALLCQFLAGVTGFESLSPASLTV